MVVDMFKAVERRNTLRPEVIELEGLTHVENREWHEYQERDHFLQDLELRQRQA
jgi:hypothetical protein